jgi:hypothetical protein
VTEHRCLVVVRVKTTDPTNPEIQRVAESALHSFIRDDKSGLPQSHESISRGGLGGKYAGTFRGRFLQSLEGALTWIPPVEFAAALLAAESPPRWTQSLDDLKAIPSPGECWAVVAEVHDLSLNGAPIVGHVN